jgi:hypothetical protein
MSTETLTIEIADPMSTEANGAAVTAIPDGTTTFQLGPDVFFKLDVVEAVRQTNAIARDCAGRENFEHLDLFRDWVKEQTGAALTLGQADWLWDEVYRQHVAAKKARLGPPTSSAPTESAPTA